MGLERFPTILVFSVTGSIGFDSGTRIQPPFPKGELIGGAKGNQKSKKPNIS
jgi:hypothetical protein